ncbi:SUMO ligase siz1 [Podila humilis]|nr:SUMO ligase siz1 [Podila humilis]
MEDLATITGRIIPGLLVNQLKALIKNLNETIRPAPQLKLGGNKAELIYRLTEFIVKYNQIGDQVVIRQIRQCVRHISQGDPEYQLMVFCGWVDSPPQQPILMEFPAVCEIKVNGRVLEANLRGMKNKPGTVSPANITRLCRLESADFNKVEFIYANSTKRYYASTHLVKRFSVQSIVAEIENGKFLSKEKMLQMIEDRNKDDDIMATSSTLSLKCPLGFQRINIPCRSSYCHHLQCFDAYTFFELNEQTPTWTCPVCSRIMHSWEEIVVDGYFKDILNSTPKSLESVTVQADGSWDISTISENVVEEPVPKSKAVDPSNVFCLDDDSDEEPVAQASPTPAKPAKPAIEVIDLISDSEDEEEERPTGRPAGTDDDFVMQEAADSLQTMAGSTSGTNVSHSVKTEDIDKTAPTTPGVEIGHPAPDIHSVSTSTQASPTTSSSDSPVISTRMSQNEIAQPQSHDQSQSQHPDSEVGSGTHSPAPRQNGAAGWETNTTDSFLNSLLNPRRKRQFEDIVDKENLANMSNDARQRISRLDIRSTASSERGSSAVPSPDIARRSTSSPTPATQDYYQQQSEGENRRRSSRELFLNASYYSENGHIPRVGQTTMDQRYSRDSSWHGSSLESSRSLTKSPPVSHYGYSNTTAMEQRGHSTDHYSPISRPLSTGPPAGVSMSSWSGSTSIMARNASNSHLGIQFDRGTGWTASDGHHANDRTFERRPDTSPSSGHGRGLYHRQHPGPRRVSYEETRSSMSSTGPQRSQQQYPTHSHPHAQHIYTQPYNQHSPYQQNVSNNDSLFLRQGSTAGAPQYHSSHSTHHAESSYSSSRGGLQHPQPQHLSSADVYSNGDSTPSPGEAFAGGDHRSYSQQQQDINPATFLQGASKDR